jgi:hypothetical protein
MNKHWQSIMRKAIDSTAPSHQRDAIYKLFFSYGIINGEKQVKARYGCFLTAHILGAFLEFRCPENRSVLDRKNELLSCL